MLTAEFLKLSSKLGKNHMLVQGAGGNTSIKQNNKMWIKASGTWLSKSIEENIFADKDLRDNTERFSKTRLILYGNGKLDLHAKSIKRNLQSVASWMESYHYVFSS